MGDIIKTFNFNCENVELVLNIKKEISKATIKMFIDGEVICNNKDLKLRSSTDNSSADFNLIYIDKSFFWISYNKYKGMRWDKYNNETKYEYYRNLDEMKNAYIKQREFITIISNYFYDSLRKFKQIKILNETPIGEVYSDN